MVELSDENKRQFFIPRGFAHGFLVLSDEAIFTYKVDNMYAPQAEAGIRWNDPQLGIQWPVSPDEVLTSETLQNALQKSLAPKASETGIALGDESWTNLVNSAQEVVQHITQVQEEAVQRMEEAGEEFANPTDLLPADEGSFFTYLRDFMQKNNAQDDTSGLKSIPGQMKAAVKEGVENIRVTLDGERVGRLVAPYVSQQIARDAYV